MYRGTIVLIVWFCSCQWSLGQLDFDGPPINYGKQPSSDRVARLIAAMKSGEVELQRDEKFGVLPSLLEALDIPANSQGLVFSKTSFQLHKIDPRRPRAVYFNDDTYVGWVRGSELLELAAVDAEQGGMFYTFDASQDRVPQLDQGQCLICHANLRTQGVPGFLVRSVICDPAGRFVSGSPGYVTDHSSPFKERWGGWYVTGTHGSLKHLGNVLCEDKERDGWLDPDAGQNLQQLPERISAGAYLSQGSDLVALMVLEHQTQMHNLITRAAYEARTAAHQDAGINEALGRPSDYITESTGRRIAAVSEKLVRYLLYADEFPLSERVSGTSSFAADFSQRGPRDKRGRSLYQLDLHSRLMKYPCSYLIYSPAFDALPETVKRETGRRLRQVLLEPQADDGFSRLTKSDRTAVAEILAETKTEFWKRYVMF